MGKQTLSEGLVDLLGGPDARYTSQGELLESMLDATGSSVVVTNPHLADNPIVYVSRGFERLTGYAPDEAVGKNCRFLQGEDRDQAAVKTLREAIAAREPVRVTLRNYRKNGDLFWNELTVAPVFEGGDLILFTGVQRDVSEIKTLEQHLSDAQAEADELRKARLSELLASSAASSAARSLGVAPVRESAPELFGKAVESYGRVLEDALENRAYRVAHDVTAKLRDIASQLAALRAGARDVIELHTASLRGKHTHANAARTRAYDEEGRLLVLELMGLLLNEYRPYAFRAQRQKREAPHD